MKQAAKPQNTKTESLKSLDERDPDAQPNIESDLTLSGVVSASRWLAGSTYRLNPLKIIAISLAQVLGALGTAVGTLAVLIYIRAAAGDGSLGRINIQIESAAEPATAGLFLVSVLIIIIVAAGSLWLSEKAMAVLTRDHAERLRVMILELLADPHSKDWQDTVGFQRPATELQQVLVSRIRSMTVALTDVIALGPASLVLITSLIIMFIIDPIAALLLLPFSALFGILSERTNKQIQGITAQYERRQERTREALANNLEDFFSGHTGHEELSMARVSTDDRLFHDRQLATVGLRLLTIVSTALLFVLTAAVFILFRGVESLSIEIIIAYIYAIRFATRSAQQINKALTQVSRRHVDIEAVQSFIASIDDHRAEQANVIARSDIPHRLDIGEGSPIAATVARSDVALVLSAEPVTEESAAAALRSLVASSQVPGLDLTNQVRIFSPDDGKRSIDILGSAQIRVIISDDPLQAIPPKRNTYTFVMHNRPKLLLAKTVKGASDQLGPAFVIRGGKIVWAGSVEEAGRASQEIRNLAKRPQPGKPRRRTPNIQEPTKS